MKKPFAVATLVLVMLAPAKLVAHPVPFSYLDLRMVASGIEGTLVVHVIDAAHELGIDPASSLLDGTRAAQHFTALTRLLGARLRLASGAAVLPMEWTRIEVAAERQSLRLSFRAALPGSLSSLTVAGRLFPYDANHRTFLNIYDGEALTQAILDSSRESFDYFAGTRQGAFAVVRKFLPAGVHHILIGPDHLLFLVGLLLLGGTVKRLALVVTAFTVAHSITLTLAALRLVDPPASVIEPAIALSIVYVGVDNLLIRQGRDVRPWIALAFGLIHGFGFANVLREMDLPPRALGWSLFSFNVGVEIGQLLVVVVAASALAAVRARSEVAGRRIAVAGSVAVIAAGGYWFLERVFFAGGLR
jgi:hydrogenase/urease accessory protein HupE